jgi:hypothetical protein
MVATHPGQPPKVLLDGHAWADALKEPATGVLHLAFEERLTLVVSQAIIEDLGAPSWAGAANGGT